MQSLRVRLALLLLLAAALPAAVIVVAARRLNRQTEVEALESARLLASLVASGYEAVFDGVEQLVQNYASSDELAEDPPTCPMSMGEMVRRHGQLLNFAVVTPDGTIRCSVLPVPPGASLAGRPVLRDALAAPEVVFSDFETGVISGQPVMLVAKAVRDGAGRPRAVVVAGLALRSFLELGRVGRLPPGAVLRVVDRTGVVLAHHPDNEVWQGRLMPTGGGDSLLLRADSGMALFAALDGVPRRHGFATIRPGGSARVSVAVGLEGLAGVESIRRLLDGASAAAMLALGVAVMLVLVGGKRLLLDDVNRLLDTADAIGRGDFAASAAIPDRHGDLARVSRALDGLGRQLGVREAQLRDLVAEREAQRDELQALYDALPVGIVQLTADLRVTRWSAGAERLFEWRADEVLGQPLPFVPDDERELLRKRVSLASAQRTIATYEAVRCTKSGRCVPVSVLVVPASALGRDAGGLAVYVDISERRTLEERERAARERLQAIVAAAPLGILAIDAGRRVTLWSAGGERIFRMPASRMLGRVMPDGFASEAPPEQAALWRRLFDRVLAGDSFTDLELENPPGHPVREFSLSGVPLREESGDVTGAMFAMADITARKTAERALAGALAAARAERDRFAAVVEAAPVAIVSVDAELTVRLWSPAAERIFGWRADEVLGRPLPFRGEDDLALRPRIVAEARAGRTVRVEISRSRKDGGSVWVSAAFAPLLGPDGRFEGVLGVLQDISQARAAMERVATTLEELRRLSAHLNRVREEEQERLAREVHDEFGQLLTGLKLDLTLLERQLPDAPGNESARQRIPQMRALVDELVSAGRRIVSELRPPALDRLGLGAALDALVSETSRRGLEVTGHVDADTTGLDSETATALYRIAQEGLTNVLKHSGARHAGVHLARTDGSLRLVVEDDGRGLPEPSARRAGVGLVSMRERAALVGGTLRVERRPDGGTAVVAEVPWRPAT